MRENRTSGLMSGEGKRGVAAWHKLPRPSSTLPAGPWGALECAPVVRQRNCVPSQPSTMRIAGRRVVEARTPLPPRAAGEVEKSRFRRAVFEFTAAARARSDGAPGTSVRAPHGARAPYGPPPARHVIMIHLSNNGARASAVSRTSPQSQSGAPKSHHFTSCAMRTQAEHFP